MQILRIAHVFSIVAMIFLSFLNSVWSCYVVFYWQCLDHYKHYRAPMLLKMLHKCCNMAVLWVLLIYPHSPLGAACPWESCVNIPSWSCYNILIENFLIKSICFITAIREDVLKFQEFFSLSLTHIPTWQLI